MTRPKKLVAVGASWGGFEAISLILGRLPRDIDACVVIGQHRGKDDEDGLREALARVSAIPLLEAEDKQPLLAGHAFLAPSDYHLLIEPDRLALSVDPPVNFARPSIDVLFESAADAYGADAVGVLLTGLGRDGALGLGAMHRAGGTTLVQDPGSAVSPALPRAALELFAPTAVRPLADLSELLRALLPKVVTAGAAPETAQVTPEAATPDRLRRG